MFGTFFGRGCDLQKIVAPDSFGREHIRYGWLALGDCSCFIKNNGINFMRVFQSLAAFYQNAVRGASAGSDHDGGRRGEPQCAGAGNHQHGDKDG
ncbi:hypothetical protein SDC9_194371 [bioreactor metagenome]|uniref:Uncharacterized protein n=1 Tax=bioreactor metagenome TaxID=1076179 RepID=A0A645IHE3_9ZZZZ